MEPSSTPAMDLDRPLSPSEVVWDGNSATWNGIDLSIGSQGKVPGRPGEVIYTVRATFVDAGTALTPDMAKVMAMRKAVALYDLMMKGVCP